MNRKHRCVSKGLKKKEARERKRGTWGQGKRRETEEEKAENILSPQMYGVLSDVHMPKTLIHSYKHTHTHARAHAHTSMQCDGHFARGRKGGGGAWAAHISNLQRGGGVYRGRRAVSWPSTKSSGERLRTNNTLGSIRVKLRSQPCDYCYQSRWIPFIGELITWHWCINPSDRAR